MTIRLILIFALGVLCLAGMVAIAIWFPEPTDFQLRVFQVVLATAAGGVGALLPGTFGINTGIAKAAGAVGLFVLVFWVDPPALQYKAAQTKAFESSMQQGEAAWNTPGLSRLAEHKFVEASRIDPASPLPHNGLGRTYHREGQFESAVAAFQKAFELSGKSEPTYLYSKANSEIALGKYDQAAKTFELATSLGGSVKSSELAKIIAYDFGATRFAQWRNASLPIPSSYYDDAVTNFSLFLESGGYPKQWAYYNLACLRALNAGKRVASDPEGRVLRVSAVSELSNAVAEISRFKGDNQSYHVRLIRAILADPKGYKQQRGDPPPCPVLAEIWVAERGPVTKLLAVLD